MINEIKESCINCIYHSKIGNICLHAIYETLIEKEIKTQGELDLMEILWESNHNYNCFKHCTMRDINCTILKH